MKSQFLLPVLAVGVALVGCGGSSDSLGDASNEASAGPMTTPPDMEQSMPPGWQASPEFDPFEIPIHQSVTVGAFLIDLGVATVVPQELGLLGDAVVRIDFAAENLSTEIHVPFATIDYEGLLIEAAGQYLYGRAIADEVPGLRRGVGTLSWTISLDEDIAVDDLRDGVLTIGSADQNQVVVPFAEPTATATLADIDLQQTFVIGGVRDADLEVLAATVQYSRHSSNELLEAGTAELFLSVVLTNVEDRFGEYWGEENVFLERPDGISVAPDYLNEDVRPTERAAWELEFEIEQPIHGAYVFGVFDRELGTRTVTIEVP